MPEICKSAQDRLANLDAPEQKLFKHLRGVLFETFKREWEGKDYQDQAEWSAVQTADKIAGYWEKFASKDDQDYFNLDDEDPELYSKLRGVVFRVFLELGEIHTNMKRGVIEQYKVESEIHTLKRVLDLFDKYHPD